MARKTPARPDTWMPMYWGDYLKDTGHLSTLEHGAYLLLISHYWSSGKALPDDDGKLAQISRQAVAQWRKMRVTVAEFFIIEGGKWHHKRVEEELTTAFNFIEKQTENGSKGGRPRNPTETQPITQTKPTGFAKAKPKITTSPSPSHTESPSSEISTGPARGSALDVGSAPRAKGPSDLIVAQLAALRRNKVEGSA